jgi:hypothetical protein
MSWDVGEVCSGAMAFTSARATSTVVCPEIETPAHGAESPDSVRARARRLRAGRPGRRRSGRLSGYCRGRGPGRGQLRVGLQSGRNGQETSHAASKVSGRRKKTDRASYHAPCKAQVGSSTTARSMRGSHLLQGILQTSRAVRGRGSPTALDQRQQLLTGHAQTGRGAMSERGDRNATPELVGGQLRLVELDL